jgi:nitrogen fixation protein NifB
VDRFAVEYIEESALSYYADYAAQLNSGSIVEKVGADAVLRQGAYIAKDLLQNK